MLNRLELISKVSEVSDQLYHNLKNELNTAKVAWDLISDNLNFNTKANSVTNTNWKLPKWDENLFLNNKFLAKGNINEYIVFSSDGSQIYPDRHMGSNCFLINTSKVLLQYGENSCVEFSSEPTVFTGEFNSQNLNIFEKVNITDLIDCRRQEYELKAGLEIANNYLSKNNNNLFKLYLCDGALTFWHLESKPDNIKKIFWKKYLDILNKFYEKRVPIIGYISLPNSKELVNLIRAELCDFELTKSSKSSLLSNIYDINIASFYLDTFEYSNIFTSTSKIYDNYTNKDLKPSWVYFNTGSEIARIEFPSWVIKENLLDKIISIIASQVNKGSGYPICIAEAHEQAVVNNSDREFFYSLLNQNSLKNNQVINISRKLLRKKFIGI